MESEFRRLIRNDRSAPEAVTSFAGAWQFRLLALSRQRGSEICSRIVFPELGRWARSNLFLTCFGFDTWVRGRS
jgi:hypothetical protein